MAIFLAVLLFTSALSAVHGSAFVPAETHEAFVFNGFSPRPTSGPFAAKAGLKRAANIFARSSEFIATCGYTTADEYAPKTCPIGQNCGWLTAPPGGGDYLDVLVCCPTDEQGNANWADCPPPSTCLNYNAHNNTGSDSSTVSNTVFCGSGAHSCATLSFRGGYTGLPGLSTISFTSLFCSDVSTVEWVFQTYSNTPRPSSSSSYSPSTTPTTSSGLPQQPTSSKTSTTSTSPTTKPASKDSSDTGAIAGGVVGGVLFGAAIVGIITWLCIRKSRKRITATPEISEYSPGMR